MGADGRHDRGAACVLWVYVPWRGAVWGRGQAEVRGTRGPFSVAYIVFELVAPTSMSPKSGLDRLVIREQPTYNSSSSAMVVMIADLNDTFDAAVAERYAHYQPGELPCLVPAAGRRRGPGMHDGSVVAGHHAPWLFAATARATAQRAPCIRLGCCWGGRVAVKEPDTATARPCQTVVDGWR